MKGIIIYKGKYGATQQYAGWLSGELNLPMAVSDEITPQQLESYDFLILGCSVYVGKMLLKDWLKKNVAAIQGKKLFFFLVSGTPLGKREVLEGYLQANIPAEIRNRLEVYFLPGRMILKNLSWFDRLMMKMGTALAKGEEAKKEMQLEYDEVKKENTHSLVNAVRKFTYDTLIKQQSVEKEKPVYVKRIIESSNN
jgi:menaquinone-dependent protoporphyrinogen IX oxidase